MFSTRKLYSLPLCLAVDKAVQPQKREWGVPRFVCCLSTELPMVFDDRLLVVWIDADHSEESVTKDIKNYLPKVKKGGIICGHDYDFEGVKKAVHKYFETVEEWPDDVWVMRL